MTALDAIKRAMRMLGVIAEHETPAAAQGVAALDMLNGMLASWEGEGIRLNMPTLELATTIPLPATHNDCIAYNLAISIAAEFGKDIKPAVAKRAEDTYRALQAAYAYVPTLACEPELVRSGYHRHRGYR